MPADLAENRNGEAAFISLREMPWHRAGVVVDEELPGREFLNRAGLDFPVATCPITGVTRTDAAYAAVGWDDKKDAPILGLKGGTEVSAPHPRLGVFRGDTGQLFPNVVGAGYELYQPVEIIDFFQDLAQNRRIVYECAGALGVGETMWVLARIPELEMAVNGDAFRNYVMIRTGFCGNVPLEMFPTSVRVVCSNTMASAVAERSRSGERWGTAKGGYRIRHTKNMRAVVAEVTKGYGKLLKDFDRQREMFEFLAGKPVTQSSKREFFDWVAAGNKVSDEIAALRQKPEASLTRGDKTKLTRNQQTLDTLERLYESETNQQPGTKDTLFSLYQTAVEYFDHERPVRCQEGEDCAAKRIMGNVFTTQGARLKEDTLLEVLELAGA